MSETIQLVGLDFGTTTSSAVVAEARLTRNAVTGRTDLDGVRERFRSDMIFTPMAGNRINEAAIARSVDSWLEAGGVRAGQVFGGGALLTGLTAQRDNADALVKLVRARLGDALIATANDPCLESWLAYMGSAAALSRANPDLYVLNLDIGGGTTNLALGRGGEVLRTGCLFVGARHVQVEPGGYRIVRLSRYADALLNHLKIERKVGEEMTPIHVEAVLTWYLDLLDAAIAGRREHFEEPTARLHEQVPYRPLDRTAFVVTLSGGVGELVYRALDGKPLPPTTAFGDLGIDLAQRLLQSHWVDDFRRYRPASCGRATVYGLLRHNTEISGSTLYLPHPEMLPLADVPILGSITPSTNAEEMRYLFMLAGRCDPGGCVRVQVGSHDAGDVEMIGQRIAAALQESAFPLQRTLVLLVQENVGKALGHYATHWGTLPNRVIVIDEVTLRFVRYARIGAPRQQVVPVSYFGLHDEQ